MPPPGCFRCSALLNELDPVHHRAFFCTEFPFGTGNACFLHRMPQKTRRVHQEPLYGTARPFRTPGSPLRYRMLHRQKGGRPCLHRIPQTARKEKAIAKSAARNAAASKKITAKKFAMPSKATQCHSEKPRCPKATQCPQKVDITPLSKSKKPISELTGFLVVGRRIELLLRD